MEKYFKELKHNNDECGCNNCNCEHEHNHDHEMQKINLELEDGRKLTCIVLATFEVKEKEYIALLPENEEDVFLYELIDSENGIELINIENDNEFELVSKAFYELFEDEE